MENQIIESHKRRIEQRKTVKKDKIEVFDMTDSDSDDNFAFIAGYTSGGFPFGLTHEEFERARFDNDDRRLTQ